MWGRLTGSSASLLGDQRGPMKRGLRPRSTERSGAYACIAGVVAAVLAGVLSTTSLKLSVGALGIVALALFAVYARQHTNGAVLVLLLSLMLIPVYAVPSIGPLDPEPAIFAAAVLAAVRVATRERTASTGYTALDIAFTATCVAIVFAAVLGPAHVLATLASLLLWVPLYFAGRTICLKDRGAESFAWAAAVAACLLVPFIAYEAATQHNVFLSLAIPGTTATKEWAHPVFRSGTNLYRADGPFGHPLSMAIIVGASALFAVAGAVRATTRLRRYLYVLAAFALVATQYTSGERTGWIVVIAGFALFSATRISRTTRRRYKVIVLVTVIGMTALALTEISNSSTSAALSSSTGYRTALYAHALQPGALKLFGLPENLNGTGFNIFVSGAENQAQGQASSSIDSAYLQVADNFGLAALVPLLTLPLAAAWAAGQCRKSWLVVFPVVAFALLLALFAIGFQTQVPMFVWLVVGGASGAQLRWKRLRTVQTADAQPVPTGGLRSTWHDARRRSAFGMRPVRH